MMTDDDLRNFEIQGAPLLPDTDNWGVVGTDGASIWYAVCGTGPAVVLLHGGLGHSGNWGYQVPALVESGRQVIVLDSRGHGRSTNDTDAYDYELMAGDVLAVMDELSLEQAALVGWSDGACTALITADKAPERVKGVFFFACCMDPGGGKEFVVTPVIDRCFKRHRQDYTAISATPDQFDEFVQDVTVMMTTEPNYTAEDLGKITVSVAVVLGEHDEFVKPEHAAYLARSLPNAELIMLADVSHFAPLQRPAPFNRELLRFLDKIGA